MRRVEMFYKGKERVYDLDDPMDMVRYIARHRYAWPGGYELCAVMDDSELLCSGCVLENYKEILTDTKEGNNTGWRVQGITHESEMEDDYCAHCNKALGYQSEEPPEEEP